MKNNIPNCYTKEEWEKVKKQFDTDFKRYNKHIKSFRESFITAYFYNSYVRGGR